jgi:protein tyrosine phosphatase (PTP) superfamily phosphohydrolase (DUF442 family)
MFCRRSWRLVILLTATIVVLLCSVGFLRDSTLFLWDLAINSNLHEVVRGKVYRSGEMRAADLRNVIVTHGIRTVVDLRAGEDKPTKGGTRPESEVVSEAGGIYVHVPFKSTRLPPKQRLQELVELFDHVQTPVLFHCSSGQVRSAVAAFIWLVTQERASPDVALHQLTTRFGYYPLERTIKRYMVGHELVDDLVWRYMDARKQRGTDFRSWLVEAVFPEWTNRAH